MAASGRVGRTLSKTTAKKQYLERNYQTSSDSSPANQATLSIPRSVSSPVDCPGPNQSFHSSTHTPFHDPQTDYKIVLFGANKVGKSALIRRFTKGVYSDQYSPTIEDAYRQVVSYNKQIFYLQIIDTSGGYQFPAMHRLSIETGNAFVLVYSVHNKETLTSLEVVREDIRARKVPVVLVGNMADDLMMSGDQNTATTTSITNNTATASNNLFTSVPVTDATESSSSIVQTSGATREVPTDMGHQIAESWHCDGFIETSAKLNINVKELFQELIQIERSTYSGAAVSGGNMAGSLHRTHSSNKSFRLLTHTSEKLNKRCMLC